MQLTSPRCVQHAQCAHHPNFSLSTAAPSAATYSASSSHSTAPPPTAVVTQSSPGPCCVNSEHPPPQQSPSSSSLLTASTSCTPLPPVPQHAWLTELLSATFYKPCAIHTAEKKCERNIFCVSHAQVMCQHCQREAHPCASKRPSSSAASSLKHHPRKNANQTNNPNSLCTILHVSRYMYHHVVPLREMNALMDVSLIQSYLNNGNKVIYLDRRAQSKSKVPPNANACLTCSRTLHFDYNFCCIYCCLKHTNHPALSRHIPLPNTALLNNQPARASRSASRGSVAKRAAPPPASRCDPCAPACATRSSADAACSAPSHSTAETVADAERTASNAVTALCADVVEAPRLKRARKQPNPERAAQLVVTACGTFVAS